MNKLKRSYPGFTLVEMSAVVVVLSIIGFSVVVTFNHIVGSYRKDTVRMDVRHYGNTVMREITDRISHAQKVEFGSFQGFAEIMLYDDPTKILYKDKIKAIENEGILLNDEAMIGGSLLFPDKGQFRENDQFEVSVTNFTVTEAQENLPGMNKFKKAMVHINLGLTLKSNVMQNDVENIEQINFTRGMFLSNNYIGSIN
mgnify:CR=1 FL=1